MKKLLTVLAVAVVVTSSLGISTSAWATTTYSYTGNNFNIIENIGNISGTYDTSMSLTGWFEVASPIAGNATNLFIAPLSYSFYDGRNTYTNLNSGPYYPGDSFKVWTDSTGNIINWYIVIYNNEDTGSVQTANYSASYPYDQGFIHVSGPTTTRDGGKVFNNPGVWTSTTTPTPSPARWCCSAAGCWGWSASAGRNSGGRP